MTKEAKIVLFLVAIFSIFCPQSEGKTYKTPNKDSSRVLIRGSTSHVKSSSKFEYVIRSDSTVSIKEKNESGESEIKIPANTFSIIFRSLERRLLTEEQETEYLLFSHEGKNLLLRVSQRFNLYVFATLLIVTIVGGSLLLWLWRRLARERRRREALVQSRRYLTKGREKERERLAQEIHDGPVQDLHGLHMQINAFPEAPDLEKVGDELMRVTGELRAMSADLHPPALQRFGLPAALRSHADRLRNRHPDVELDMDLAEECDQMPDEYALSIFRIAQEAMNNAVQHGEARHVQVRLDCPGDTVTLVIDDDGTGFTLPDDWHDLAEQEHFGLLGMRERAEAINASLNIESELEEGTHIRLHGIIDAFDAEQPTSDEASPVPA